MTNISYDLSVETHDRLAPDPVEIAPVPRITIHAFFETSEMARVVESAAIDRRMSRAHVSLRPGGVVAATETYRQAPTPNLLLLEIPAQHPTLLSEIDALSLVCEPETKLIVIGRNNDVALYRDLLERGVSEYLVAPVDVLTIIGAVSRLYHHAKTRKLGRICAFIGAKGGVGSSTVAHNVAATLAYQFGADVMLADMDFAFGTADLNFNLIPSQGIADAVRDTERLDETLLDRLLTPCRQHLSLLAAPSVLDETCDFAEGTFEQMLEIAQAHVPFTVLDLPHVWTSWAKKTLVAADEVVITSTPDLANLRNTKSLLTLLKQARPNDASPKFVLNQVGMKKRPEIRPQDFAKALELEPISTIRFDPQVFGDAANKGQMIRDVAAKSDIVSAFEQLAEAIAGRKETKRPVTGFASFRKKLGKW